MSYRRQEWIDGDTSRPISAARLGYIETGIESAHQAAEESNTKVVALEQRVSQIGGAEVPQETVKSAVEEYLREHPIAPPEGTPGVDSAAIAELVRAELAKNPPVSGDISEAVKQYFQENPPIQDNADSASSKDAKNALRSGAKGDGNTDDTAALQALFDSGEEVYIPAGTYLVEGTITPTKAFRVRGAGRGLTKIVSSSAGAVLNLQGSALLDGCHLSDLSIEASADDIISGGRLARSVFERVTLRQKSKAHAVWDAPAAMLLLENTFMDVTSYSEGQGRTKPAWNWVSSEVDGITQNTFARVVLWNNDHGGTPDEAQPLFVLRSTGTNTQARNNSFNDVTVEAYAGGGFFIESASGTKFDGVYGWDLQAGAGKAPLIRLGQAEGNQKKTTNTVIRDSGRVGDGPAEGVQDIDCVATERTLIDNFTVSGSGVVARLNAGGEAKILNTDPKAVVNPAPVEVVTGSPTQVGIANVLDSRFGEVTGGNITDNLKKALAETNLPVVEIPAGQYVVDSIPVAKLAGRVLRGAGAYQTTLMYNKAATNHMFIAGSGDKLKNATFTNFGVNMRYDTGDTLRHAFQITNSLGTTFRGLRLRNVGGIGILLQTYGTNELAVATGSVFDDIELDSVGLDVKARGTGFGIKLRGDAGEASLTNIRGKDIRNGMAIGGEYDPAINKGPSNVIVEGCNLKMGESPTMYEPVGFTRGCSGIVVRGNHLWSKDNGVSVSGSMCIIENNVIHESFNFAVAAGSDEAEHTKTLGTIIRGNICGDVGLENEHKGLVGAKRADYAVFRLSKPSRCIVQGNTYVGRSDLAAHFLKIYGGVNFGLNDVSGNTASVGDFYKTPVIGSVATDVIQEFKQEAQAGA